MTTAVKLQRRPDWPEQLDAYVRRASVQTFAWGQHDCALFSLEAVLAMTGEDLGASFRGCYAGRISAAKFVKRVFGGDTATALASILESAGCKEVVPSKARRGDVLLLNFSQDALVGIVHPCGVCAVTVGLEGVVMLSMNHAVRAWRVG